MKFIYRIGIAFTAGIALLVGGEMAATTAHATVIKNSFLQTQRTIHTTNSKKQVKLTLPNKTVVQATAVKNRGGRKFIYINGEQLSYRLRKPLLASKSTSNYSAWIPATRANFKQVKTPVYLSYYNTHVRRKQVKNKTYHTTGNLWKGHALPTNYTTQKDPRLRITTDGYLEYFANSPFVYRTSPRPTATLKVISASHPGGSGKDIMTFHSSFSALPFKKVANTNTLTIQWTARSTVTAIPNENNVKLLTQQYVSKIGGQEWYNLSSTINY